MRIQTSELQQEIVEFVVKLNTRYNEIIYGFKNEPRGRIETY